MFAAQSEERRMRRYAACLLLALPLALPSSQTLAGTPLQVFVSIPPEQTFVERIGGPLIVAESMIRPGVNPHTYEPTPNQIARLASARLYIGIGFPFEKAWAGRIRAVNPSIRFLDAHAGIQLHVMDEHDHDEEHSDHEHDSHNGATELDPHIWTSPLLVKQVAHNISRALAELDPDHAQDYAQNLAVFHADLDALDRDIRAELAGLKQRRFMVFHPAWGYFAETYGLVQVPIEKAGKEPGPRRLAALIDQARREDVKTIFVQPQFPKKSAEQVARAIGGHVDVIDNLASDYMENLRRVARAIATSGR
jgi:zinc transport system substrate-binding protein